MREQKYELRDLFWEATLRCNARCAFCGSRCTAQSADELTTEEILSAFRSVAADMDASRIMINVTGGEPLLREDLFEVMGACREMGFPWGMVSNGMLITPEIVEKMRGAGMRTVSVSLDGLREIHDRLRGVEGGFDRAVRGIRLLVDGGFLEHIQVTTVVTRENIGQLEAQYAFLKTLGIHSWRVAVVDEIGRACDNRELLLTVEDLKEYLAFIRRYGDDPVLPVITSCSHYFGALDRGLGREGFRCRTGIDVASILANGDIYVCPNVPRRPELVQGNVRRDRFSEAWRDGFAFFRNPECRLGEKCSGCPDWAACRGDSMHTWNFEEHRPNFCFRDFFPAESGPNSGLEDVTRRLKTRANDLKGVRVSYGEGRETLVFTPNASEELYHFFRWGVCYPGNMSEQMVCLIGRELSDCTLVEFVAPVFLEHRNTDSAGFSERSRQSALEELDAINRAYLLESCGVFRLFDEPCRLVGFAHSHPAGVPFAPSEADLALQRDLMRTDGIGWSMLVNPQRRRIAAFFGKDMTVSDVLLLTEGRNVSRWTEA